MFPILRSPPCPLALADTPLRVGVVTSDPELVKALQVVVAQHHGRLTVATDAPSADELFASHDDDALVVDFACPWVGLRSRALPLLDASLLVCQRELGASAGEPLRFTAFRRKDVARLVEHVGSLASRASVDPVAAAILGDAPAIRQIRETIHRIAQFRSVSVLVLGETGTGKELVARAIHDTTNGPGAPFVAVNCAAIPDTLVESELFGHGDGAFTGSRGARVGLLELARGGTLFLDEIGEMPAALQPKLLRAIEARTFRPLGTNRDVPLGARIVSATNRPDGSGPPASLRSDLYYRLAGFTLRLPALRERGADVRSLGRHFVRSFAASYGALEPSLSEGAWRALERHGWPGNVRELRLVVERLTMMASGGRVEAEHVGDAIGACPGHAANDAAAESSTRISVAPSALRAKGLREFEREAITHAFTECGGNLSHAAQRLQIPRTTLRSKLRRYGLV